MTVRELIADAARKPKLQEIIDEILVVERGASPPHLLGQYLKRHRGVRVNGLRIEDGYSSERKAWRVLTDAE
jgi:CobQ-like glutamine amidotransferase family enzyme